jgi:5-methyltetrahydropteroyltriglutamate--homocysteine methyltransferase
LRTTVVGSMPMLPSRRAMMNSLWDGADPFAESLEQSVRMQVECGVDIISDGQTRRGMVELFTIPLRGIRQKARPEIVGEVEHPGPITLSDLLAAREIAGRVYREMRARWGEGGAGSPSAGRGDPSAGRGDRSAGRGDRSAGRGDRSAGDGGRGSGARTGIAGPLARRDPPEVKGIVTGPFTLARSCVNRYYPTERDAAFAIAGALNRELRELAAHTTHLQVDEPYFSVEMPQYAPELIGRTFDGVEGTRWLHVCGDTSPIITALSELPVDVLDLEFASHPELMDAAADVDSGKGLGIGAVRSDDPAVETPAQVRELLARAVDRFGPERLFADPDCGLRHMSAESARGKLAALVDAASGL